MPLRRSPHPGVKLVSRRRSSGITHYGRVLQPDGRWKDTNLNELGLRSARDRRLWAERESRKIYETRRSVALGLAPPARTPLRDAQKRYLADASARLKDATMLTYVKEAERLVSWLERRGLAHTEAVTPELLWGYREELVAKRKAPSTLERWLYTAKALLDWWRKAGFTPGLTSDAISDALEPPPVIDTPPVVYKPAQLRALLEAAIAEGWEPACSISLYLLSGMRFGELCALTWGQVDLEALPGGEIRIGGESKTGIARSIDLSIIPAAKKILEALPRRAPRVCPWIRTANAASTTVFRLRRKAKLPEFTWQHLRETSATYQACAPSVWGAASAYRTARQLGHSVAIAEKHYLGVLRGIPPEARTLEAAMGIEDLVERIAELAKAAPRPRA